MSWIDRDVARGNGRYPPPHPPDSHQITSKLQKEDRIYDPTNLA
jgi:hypothetical protein